MDLSQLPVEQGFRLRGQQVTRVETFVDAAFAFSLTLLVIFYNELPDTVAELRDALKRVPTFAVCFLLLSLFWTSHNRWSRLFGLEDAKSTVLSLAFVLVVLVYVYPLRMVTSSGLSLLTGGFVPSELGMDRSQWMLDLQTAFIVYGLGFGVLSWLLWRLNAHALRRADDLSLDAHERFHAQSEVGVYALMTACAFGSVLVSFAMLAAPATWLNNFTVGLPMWLYSVMGGLLWTYRARRGRVAPKAATA
ncbi:Transglutaminase [Lysobacter dokdonensis DS-58]|uniref:Transglutaminase n=1 Tax=Lysobacter dokdonensis DS-58 TaxID=1300345 RepID=A0A0A2WDB5_9GAMM|nr:TMEM175 family protein [Lysobacter dokdonensis]KGQ18186.1 Transglutaminase [Lysobacter dokdonensis DS-58]